MRSCLVGIVVVFSLRRNFSFRGRDRFYLSCFAWLMRGWISWLVVGDEGLRLVMRVLYWLEFGSLQDDICPWV